MTAVGDAGEDGDAGHPPISDAELDDLFHDLSRYPKIALAVSGGADSTALTRLTRRWIDRLPDRRPDVTVLTVDHGLRQASATEARWVAKLAGRAGFDHHTLIWEGEKRKTGIQAAARAARYDLLTGFCLQHGIPALVTAHNADDQAETLLMRLARGSGVDGLSGMAAASRCGAIDLLRPLLGVSRARLAAWLSDAGQDWLEDPSNIDTAYERVRVRKALAVGSPLGLSRDHLVRSARRLGRARDALDAITADFLNASVAIHPSAYGEVPFSAFIALPEEIALRAMSRLTVAFGGRATPPRLARIEAAYTRLRSGERTLTLGGCHLTLKRAQLIVTREFGRMRQMADDLRPGQTLLWDHRFDVSLEANAPAALTLMPLGGDGIAAIADAAGRLEDAPRSALLALPSLWRNKRLCYAFGASFDREPPPDWSAAGHAEFIRPSWLSGACPSDTE